MRSQALLALPLVALTTAAPLTLKARQTTCVPAGAVYIISARGSTEAPGEGEIARTSSLIKTALPGSISVGLDYPATLDNYEDSENTGVVNLKAALTAYVASCPDSAIALLGWSQGGQIVGDVLGGASFSAEAPLPASVTDSVRAAVAFASPAHVAGKSYNEGTSTRSGIFPRAETGTLDGYAGRYLDVCLADDLFCDSGESLEPHLEVVTTFAQRAADFVVGKVQA